MDRKIGLYVNARDLEILKNALVQNQKNVEKLSNKYHGAMLGVNPYVELLDYTEGLLEEINSLRSDNPYKPKTPDSNS